MTQKDEAKVLELIKYAATSVRAWMLLGPRSAEEVKMDLDRKWEELKCQR